MGKMISLAGRGDVGTGLTGPQRWDKITRGATNKIDSADGRWIWFKFDAPDSPNTRHQFTIEYVRDAVYVPITRI